MATADSGAPDSGVLNAEERAKPRVQPKTRRGDNPSTTSPLVVSLLTVVATLGSVALGSWLTGDVEDARADEDFARE